MLEFRGDPSTLFDQTINDWDPAYPEMVRQLEKDPRNTILGAG